MYIPCRPCSIAPHIVPMTGVGIFSTRCVLAPWHCTNSGRVHGSSCCRLPPVAALNQSMFGTMFKDAGANMGSWVYVFVEIFDALRFAF